MTLSEENMDQHAEKQYLYDVSVCVPLYNEEDSVGPMYQAIVDAMEPTGVKFEIVFVDDGSRDNTFETAREYANKDTRLRLIKFRRNYGQTPAMAAGIDHARGRIVITMDGDLQNDPSDIPNFLQKIDEGYDIVVGWRHKRQDKLISRKIPSKIANWIIGKVTGVPIKDNGCSLKAYRAEVIQNIPLYNEMHRFIPAMTSLAGSRIAEIKVNHHARQFGESKYGISRTYKVILDMFTIKTILSMISHPLRWFGKLACAAGLVSIMLGILVIGEYLFVQAQPVGVFAALAVLFAALAVFLLAVGVLSELVFRVGKIKPLSISTITAKVDR